MPFTFPSSTAGVLVAVVYHHIYFSDSGDGVQAFVHGGKPSTNWHLPQALARYLHTVGEIDVFP